MIYLEMLLTLRQSVKVVFLLTCKERSPLEVPGIRVPGKTFRRSSQSLSFLMELIRRVVVYVESLVFLVFTERMMVVFLSDLDLFLCLFLFSPLCVRASQCIRKINGLMTRVKLVLVRSACMLTVCRQVSQRLAISGTWQESALVSWPSSMAGLNG